MVGIASDMLRDGVYMAGFGVGLLRCMRLRKGIDGSCLSTEDR